MSKEKKSRSDVVVIEKALINSPAFRSLRSCAVHVYLDFLGKRRLKEDKYRKSRGPRWRILNNGEIEYTYSEAEKRGISKPSFATSIDQLVERGFIDIAETGAGVYRMKTLYSISTRWKDWGTEQFVEKKRPRRPRRHGGIGFQQGHPYFPPKK